MKQGQFLRDYLIVTKPTNDHAGNCLWAFAERDGHEYFVKQFLDPKRPRPESMGSADSKRRLEKVCVEFEKRHESVIERIDPAALDAGNLVTAVDFFCEGTTYYKVTERVHAVELPPTSGLDALQRKVLLRTLGDSLQLLHGLGIVHGDLKPTNVLVEARPGPLYIAKVIDYDDAYLSGNPPEQGVIGGDVIYGAPEWVRYNKKDDPTVRGADLTTAADMFALGLMTHEYLTGARPGHPLISAGAAVNAGEALTLDGRLHERVAELISALTARDPAARPTAAHFLDVVGDQSLLELGPVTAPRRTSRLFTAGPDTRSTAPGSRAAEADGRTDASTGRRTRLRFGGSAGSAAPGAPAGTDGTASGTPRPSRPTPPSGAASPEPDAPRRSRLRIHLDNKSGD
ncbi:protein kinase [Streptomyces sp. MBT65]|uniref:protein kinase domain-containing protein n=1 Tax=Streptomyces sp. MBT65 TaxID=1488395 RepID=UPI00190C1FD4|nr:protein kinase [Streptomyces sp. MBT65]MBK3576286.1 protein kinase [Streptomyces sp. MBT65]